MVLLIFGIFCFCASFGLIQINLRYYFEWEIINLFSNNILFSLYFDSLNLIFIGTVSIISSGIYLYSKYYMRGDYYYKRFIIILLMFIISIGLLIVSRNLIGLLLGWDGLGLTSYLLVIYYNNETSANAGIITVLRNRIGDRGILIAIGLISLNGSWNFDLFFFYNRYFYALIILAGITKRAQLPFSAWLPAAMAAPTPVSALVHSSTLVTAGIYLLIRIRPIFEGSIFSSILLILGVLTIFFSGLLANFERDLKKIVALSTLSQLGLIFIILGLGLTYLAFFHLILHAFFKSTLFICVGFIIHEGDRAQDSRLIRDFFLKSPGIRTFLVLTNLTLVGFPFLTGYYSKDIILENIFIDYYNFFVLAIIIISTGFTFSYSLRLIYVSTGKIRLNSVCYHRNDFRFRLLRRVIILGLLRILGGFLVSWVYFFEGLIIILYDPEKYLIILSCLILGIVLYNICRSNLVNNICKKNIILCRYFLMWYIGYVSTKIRFFFLKESNYSIKGIDWGWLELWGAQGGQDLFIKIRYKLQRSQIELLVTFYLIFSLVITSFVFINLL